MNAFPVQILLVEDDQVDQMAFRRSLKALRVSNPLHVASDGQEALEMLRGEGGYEAIPGPLVVVLDLSMPRMDGFEFLDALRADPALTRLAVFVLTSSRDPSDLLKAYQRHIAGYLTKGRAAADLMDQLRLLQQYWTMVVLPH